MKKITIGFSKPKNKKLPIFSWAIRAYEKTPFSHVYIRWQTSVGPSICYHAARTSLHFLSDNQFEKQIETVESFDFYLSDAQFGKLLKYALETCGEKYALTDILAIPVMDFFKLGKKPFTGGPLEQYCAELVYRVIGQIGTTELTGDADRVRLKEVYQLVKNKFAAGAL